MSDNFEKFVRNNRRDFDSETPAASVWEKIETNLPKQQAKRFTLRDMYKWSAAAAIVVAVLTSAYFLIFQRNSHEQSKTNSPVVTVPRNESNRIIPEYADEFNAVYRAIGERTLELKSSAAAYPELYRQFQEDMASLDSAYQALMKQADHSPNQDLLFQAIIQNLRLRADLLSRQLMITHELKNNNTKKSNSHEKET